jgi:hypothetical protein
LSLQSRHSTTGFIPPVHFAMVMLETGSLNYLLYVAPSPIWFSC